MTEEERYIEELLAEIARLKHGEVVVTKNEAGQIVAVTRQDDDGKILSVIAESSSCEQAQRVPDGWKLVPVEPTPEMLYAAQEFSDILPPRGKRVWGYMLSAAPAPSNTTQK